MTSVGIFGLGLIGSALGQRLIEQGYTPCGFDPSEERRAKLTEMGGVASSGQDVWASDVVFSCVFDTDQLADLIDAAPSCDSILVSLSTCDPERMEGLAGVAAAKGITLVESPISGTSGALAKGEVLLLVAGGDGVMPQLEPLLNAVSQQFIHVGDIGNGNRAKLAINLVLGLNRAAMAEGIAYAEAIGLKGADFLTLARASAAHSRAMDSKGDQMVQRAFEPQGRIVQSAKDFALIQQSAAAAGQGLPFAATYLAMMQDALDNGEGDLDNSAILLPIARTPPA
ncbi:NAD(P)-dependent oxidoreductase [Octadecabacter sp. 1_MG-2023]|uniref:NAD(P)-dependent oxidoreductase n=1 Tax=unclassified Octadecabacter TaxID=196158 RepID=UPI001C09C86D|nr:MULTISPECIES: NAD(P)-dependent oxidoreductase [unclassified Octadecabacter]MBU2991718.1 NAD(P)-dependent oxidoreductase [Octadecabacter sp. B2R22]MDO6735691.1 NAD(P)-dependent oxidoreductase [Octadecabacter sp. 1_MG-2023]